MHGVQTGKPELFLDYYNFRNSKVGVELVLIISADFGEVQTPPTDRKEKKKLLYNVICHSAI